MRIRETQNHGKKRWLVDFRSEGKRRRKLFTSRSAAEIYAQKIAGEAGLDYSMTVEALWETYLSRTRARRSERSQRNSRYKGRRVLEGLSELGITQVDQLDTETFPNLTEWFASQELSENSVISYMRTFRSLIRWAEEQNMLETGQVGRMRIRKTQTNRERYLDTGEIDRLLSAVKGHWLDLPVALGLFQGLRRSEVCRLCGKDVSLKAGNLTVRQSKNGTWRTINLHPRLLPYLPETMPVDGQILCVNGRGAPLRGEWLTHRFKRLIREKIGWEDVSFHTLRHTCASQMALSGNFTLYQIARFLGHKSVQTTEKYAHLLPTSITPDW